MSRASAGFAHDLARIGNIHQACAVDAGEALVDLGAQVAGRALVDAGDGAAMIDNREVFLEGAILMVDRLA
jgi:hypothetical protein